MDLWNELCSASVLSCVAKTLTLDITRKCKTIFFIPAILVGTQFIFFIQYSRERTLLIWSSEKNLNVGLYSDIYRLISFKFSVMTKITTPYNLISVWNTWTFIQGHSCIKTETRNI